MCSKEINTKENDKSHCQPRCQGLQRSFHRMGWRWNGNQISSRENIHVKKEKEEPTVWDGRRFGVRFYLAGSPWRWQPTPVFLPGESYGQRNLAGYSPQGHKELGMTKWLRLLLSLFTGKWLAVDGQERLKMDCRQMMKLRRDGVRGERLERAEAVLIIVKPFYLF